MKNLVINLNINGFSLEREGGIHFFGASKDQPPSPVSRHHNFGQKLRTDGNIYIKFNWKPPRDHGWFKYTGLTKIKSANLKILNSANNLPTLESNSSHLGVFARAELLVTRWSQDHPELLKNVYIYIYIYICHAPNSKGSKTWEIHPKGTCKFFLFGKSNYRRSLFSFLFHGIRIYNHTKISTLQVRAL